MTEQPKDGGAAFPGSVYSQSGNKIGESRGMSLRDWFAGQVLSSAAALPMGEMDSAFRAKVAYAQADAMIAAREAT